MSYNILLYGATGYCGRLIAPEMKLWNDDMPGAYRMILAGRDATRLKHLADEHELDYRVFGLDERAIVFQSEHVLEIVCRDFDRRLPDLVRRKHVGKL